MINNTFFLVLVDIFLVIVAAYFGLQAVRVWKKCKCEDIFKIMGERPRHRMRLFYSSLFLGVIMATLSVVHGIGYVATLDTSAVDGPLTTILFLSIVLLTHSWYIYLKDVAK